MSTYVGLGCKDCRAESERFNHDQATAADILSMLPAIEVFIAEVRRQGSALSICVDTWNTCLVDFAVEHLGHDLYILDEYGHYGKTLDHYYSREKGWEWWPDRTQP